MKFFALSAHLSEDRLFDCYLADRSLDGVDPRAAEHLTDCGECRAKYDELTSVMAEMWMAADEDTSAIFTADRLRAQQEQIARRLERLDHPGRVLTFRAGVEASAQPMMRVASTGISRIAAGWIAAAAAAGLVIGAGAGLLYEGRSHVAATAMRAEIVAVTPAASADVAPTPTAEIESDGDDLRLMREVEAANDRPRTPELSPFDAFTPRAREIRFLIP